MSSERSPLQVLAAGLPDVEQDLNAAMLELSYPRPDISRAAGAVGRAIAAMRVLDAEMRLTALDDPYTDLNTVDIRAPERPRLDTLNRGQRRAYERIVSWTHRPIREPGDAYFILNGGAGTGKTYLLQMLAAHVPMNWAWSAPTNKASKVLSQMIGAPARTTFSTLGLRMSHDEDELVMEYGKQKPYFPKGTVLVVDERSMVGRKLDEFIEGVRAQYGLRVLYVGDPYQLPPVGEHESPTGLRAPLRENRATLRQVERYDNQLLALSLRIKQCIIKRNYHSPIVDDHSSREGVWVFSTGKAFMDQLLQLRSPEDYVDRKVVAWRNRTVDGYNQVIREQAFGFSARYAAGDRIMLARPVERDGEIIAYIDDEFEVREVQPGSVRADGEYLDTHRLQVTGDQDLVLDIAVDDARLQEILKRKSTAARHARGQDRKDLWHEFWDIRAHFHEVRYAYALTSHRIQGTTLRTVFVDQQDILANQNHHESFLSLMVACTRPTTWLLTY